MRKLALLASAFSAFALAAPASAANVILDPGAGGTLSGFFGQTVNASGNFTSTFTFTVPTAGLASVGLVTTVEKLGSANNIDFISAFLNGTPLVLFTMGGTLIEFGGISDVAVNGGQNTITINGTSAGNGSFAGNISFSPSSAPEPATWAMLILGFGAVGYTIRRRQRIGAPVRLAYSA